MSRINVTRRHRAGAEGARQAAENVIDELRREHHVRLDSHWEGDVLHARGRGFSATLSTSDDLVEVDVSLSFLLLPLRSRIHHEIESYLDNHLGRDGHAD